MRLSILPKSLLVVTYCLALASAISNGVDVHTLTPSEDTAGPFESPTEIAPEPTSPPTEGGPMDDFTHPSYRGAIPIEDPKHLNFVGPPEKAYKGAQPSHNWETDVDLFSPFLFNWKFYAAKYDVAGVEPAVRADWEAHATDDSTYPDCRQASPGFSINKYLLDNPQIREGVGDKCAAGYRQYLSTGIYEGASGVIGITLKEPDGPYQEGLQFFLGKGKLLGNQLVPLSASYTLAWWMFIEGAGGGSWKSVLKIGDQFGAYPKAPSILQYPSTLDLPVTRMSFIVAQTNDADFSCDPEQELTERKWHYVTLNVQGNKVEVFYDAQKVCEKENTDGTTDIPSTDKQYFWAGDDTKSSMNAKVHGLTYYDGLEVNTGMLEAMMQMGSPVVEEEP